jgi:hypothetical protein
MVNETLAKTACQTGTVNGFIANGVGREPCAAASVPSTTEESSRPPGLPLVHTSLIPAQNRPKSTTWQQS